VQVNRVTAPESYDELVARNSHVLLRLAVMLTGNAADAEDLLQATLTRTVRHGDRIAAMANPTAYLRRVMVNEHTSRGRQLLRRVRTLPLSSLRSEPAVAASSRVEHRDEAWRWLATLPNRQRAVLVLRIYEDLPDAEIAEVLGCSEGTVRSNASRGLAALRRVLNGEHS
jgi:RNA polymerase sigma-70 factor (sigma-E family)